MRINENSWQTNEGGEEKKQEEEISL